MRSNTDKPLVQVNGRDPKQCRWEAFRSSGAGGQHRNKVATAVRVTHLPSGASAQATEHKSQHRNKQEAWKRLAADSVFRAWLKRESARAMGVTSRVEREIERAMMRHNLKVERRNESGRWELFSWDEAEADHA